MKVALCFYGLLGSVKGKSGDTEKSSSDVLDMTFNHGKKHILDVNDIDIFIHYWDVDLKEEIVSLYKPKGSKFEQTKTFKIEPPLTDTRRVQNHYSRWYSCREVMRLKKAYEIENNFKYDFVALSRQDIAWQTDVDFSKFDTNYFYVPNWRQQFNGAQMGWPHGAYNRSLQDIWCFGNSDDMDRFVDIYENIQQYSIDNPDLMGNKGISNHRLMYHQLVLMKILPLRLKFAFNHDLVERSDMPLVRYKFFGDTT